jgi:hypothetical protein
MAKKRTMWAVGTDSGDFDWQDIDASSYEEAIRAYAIGNGYMRCERWSDGQTGPCELPCEYCGAESKQDEPRSCLDAQRIEAWDKLSSVRSMHWIWAGLGAHCDWCGYETFPQEGAVVYRGKVTCEDCRRKRPWRGEKQNEPGATAGVTDARD